MNAHAAPAAPQTQPAEARKPGLSSVAVMSYTDAKTGELYVALIRKADKPDAPANEWVLPAGHMDLAPEAAPAPDFNTAKTKAKEIYIKTLTTQGWEKAANLMNDGDTYREELRKQGVEFTPQTGTRTDLTLQDNVLGEVLEETGVNVRAIPGAKITQVAAPLAYAISSGFQRDYTMAPYFLIDLGKQSTPPALKPTDAEIGGAVWVKAANIEVQPDGKYKVAVPAGERDLPLCRSVLPAMELSLNHLLNDRIKEASHGMYDSPGTVKQHAGSWASRMKMSDAVRETALSEVRQSPLSESGKPATLLGPQGQATFHRYIIAASACANALNSTAQELETKAKQGNEISFNR